MRQLGLSAYYLGEYGEAHRLLSESLAISRDLDNSWAIASSLNMLSLAAVAQGNYIEVQQLLREGLAHSQKLEDRYNIGVSLNGLGLVSQALGDEEEAQRSLRKALPSGAKSVTMAILPNLSAILATASWLKGSMTKRNRCFWKLWR
ncbi:MAG: tetratricopeptide repeat protein [Anaerolineaceae bacterium]|nr:tetratricopeptide repeat protein [Anaerolineaceae bacterium]